MNTLEKINYVLMILIILVSLANLYLNLTHPLSIEIIKEYYIK